MQIVGLESGFDDIKQEVDNNTKSAEENFQRIIQYFQSMHIPG